MRSKALLAVSAVTAIVLIAILVARNGEADRARPDAAAAGARGPGGGKARRAPRGPVLATAALPASGAASPAVVQRGWGSGPDELGARAANESNPEGPMAIVAANGELVVLDQVNARVVRFGADGAARGTIPIAPDTAQDIAVGPDGRVAVLDRVTDGQLHYYDERGELVGQAPVVGGPLTESGGTTGVFVDAGGVYIEREHGEVVRVLGPDGTPDPDRPTLPGRPLRDGAGSTQALLGDRAAGLATVRVFDRAADLVWQRSVRFPAPILTLVMLDSDLAGRVYLAAHLAVESPHPPFELTAERIVVVRLDARTGADLGSIAIPPPPPADETLRPLTVDDAGTIYQLLPGPRGVEIHAHTFPS